MRVSAAARFGLVLCLPGAAAPVAYGMRGSPAAAHARALPHGRSPLAAVQAAHASGVLLDWTSGRLLATAGSGPPANPGSILKPFLLGYALRHGIVGADTRVYCRRSLHVAGRPLPCTHPADMPALDAAGALAESCNTWFAELARRMSPGDLEAALHEAGIHVAARDLGDPDTRVLTALGLVHTTVTPAQMASAYRSLLLREPRDGTVWSGLRGSVRFGMAGNARVAGVDVLGKTGTAVYPGEWWSHGWFAGGVPGQFVLVIYVPRGDGGAAASLASAVLRRALQENER